MSHLSVVSEGSQSPGRLAIQLLAEAKAAGEQQITAMLQTLELLVHQASEVVDGGDVYPAGVREVAAKLAEHNVCKAQSIYSIMRPAEPRKGTLAAVPRGEPSMAQVERSAADADYEADFPR